MSRLVALDTSHLSQFAHDYCDTAKESNDRAHRFIERFTGAGFIPLLTWNHLAELLGHDHDEVAYSRVPPLKEFRLVAWVESSDSPGTIGTIVDLDLAAVDLVASEGLIPFDALGQRVREKKIRYSAGKEVNTPTVEYVKQMRPVIIQAKDRASEIASIIHTDCAGVAKLKLSEFAQRLRASAKKSTGSKHVIEFIVHELSRQLREKGDKQLKAPEVVAEEFFSSIGSECDSMVRVMSDDAKEPLPEILKLVGVEPDQVNPGMLVEDVLDLAMFNEYMRDHLARLGRQYQEYRPKITQDQFPFWLLQRELAKATLSVPRAKGSNLQDYELAKLGLYAAFTFVDKCILECLNQVLRHEVKLRAACGKFLKASYYDQIPELLKGM